MNRMCVYINATWYAALIVYTVHVYVVKLNPLTFPGYTHMRDEMYTISQVTNLALTTYVLLLGTEEFFDESNNCFNI